MIKMLSGRQGRLALLLALAGALALLYTIGLLLDWPSWIHGSNWVWYRQLPTMRWGAIGLLLATVGFWLVLLVWVWREGDWSARRVGLLLAMLVCFGPLFQFVVLAQKQVGGLTAVFLMAVEFSQDGVRIEDAQAFISNHAANMPHYRNVHVKTQPPGWQLAFWATRQVWQAFPQTAEIVGRWLLRYDCFGTDIQGYSPAQIAATSLQMVLWLISGLAVLPLYSLAANLFSPYVARLTAVAYPLLPGLLVFPARFDAFYALVAITALWLAWRILQQGRWWHYLLLSSLLAGMTFLAFGPLAIVLLVNGYMLAHICLLARNWQGIRPFLIFNTSFFLLLAFSWGLFWLLWGASWPQMWQISQEIHHIIRINYPVWPLFNLYDFSVFLGLPLAVLAFAGGGQALLRAWRGNSLPGDGLILGWLGVLLLLNASGQVRAETGRLWLFLMPAGLLVAMAGIKSHPARARLVLLCLFALQAVVAGVLLGGRRDGPTVSPPVYAMPRSATAVAYDLNEVIGLRGYALEPQAEGLEVKLYWQALTWPKADYSVFVHGLLNGERVAQSDGVPQNGRLPSWCWRPGEVVEDSHLLVGTGDGLDQLLVGLYDWHSGQRLNVYPPVADQAIPLLPVAGPGN